MPNMHATRYDSQHYNDDWTGSASVSAIGGTEKKWTSIVEIRVSPSLTAEAARRVVIKALRAMADELDRDKELAT